MTREEKIARARELRKKGLSYPTIADRLGVSTSSVYRWLNPKRTAPYKNGRACDPSRARAYDRQYYWDHKEACPNCGRPKSPTATICLACIEDEAAKQYRAIEQWWGEGVASREIARRLGWSRGHFAMMMHRLREKGYDLPYRYQHRRHLPRFPAQVPT